MFYRKHTEKHEKNMEISTNKIAVKFIDTLSVSSV